MANVSYLGRFVIDTPSDDLVGLITYFVKFIRVVGSDPDSVTRVTDKDDQPRWESRGDAESIVEMYWYDGFKVTQLDSGTLYIYVC